MGFDYGTCFTKILTRVRGDKQAQVLVIDPPVEGAPPFVSHSLVGETSDGCLYFGARVLRENCRHVHRSLKVKLLPPRNAPPDRRRVRTEGDVRVDVLVAAYLTWALNEVVRALDQEHGVDGYTATLNVAAPMDHYGDAALRDRYLRILQAAWSASFGSTHFEIEQGVSAREVRNWALPLLEPHIPIERPETRLFEILPETIAPLVSLSLDPRMGPGQYLLVDVGAGTTEMSINRAGERGADQSVLCYFDQSIFLGVDDFERDPQELHGRDGHISKLCKAARRTWTLGYQKDAPNHHVRKNWKELTVLLAGGGCMRADVRAALEESSPLVMWGPAGGTNYRLKSHRPHAIRLGGRQQEHDSLQLLAVAHGLSVPRQEWPRFFPPGDVAPLSSTQTVERPPTDWYLYG